MELFNGTPKAVKTKKLNTFQQLKSKLNSSSKFNDDAYTNQAGITFTVETYGLGDTYYKRGRRFKATFQLTLDGFVCEYGNLTVEIFIDSSSKTTINIDDLTINHLWQGEKIFHAYNETFHFTNTFDDNLTVSENVNDQQRWFHTSKAYTLLQMAFYTRGHFAFELSQAERNCYND